MFAHKGCVLMILEVFVVDLDVLLVRLSVLSFQTNTRYIQTLAWVVCVKWNIPRPPTALYLGEGWDEKVNHYGREVSLCFCKIGAVNFKLAHCSLH